MDLSTMSLEDLRALNQKLHDEEEAIRIQRTAIADAIRVEHSRAQIKQALASAGVDAAAIALAFPKSIATPAQ